MRITKKETVDGRDSSTLGRFIDLLSPEEKLLLSGYVEAPSQETLSKNFDTISNRKSDEN